MGKRTTQLGEITTIDDNDILYGVDVDDLTHSPDGTSVKFKKSNLLKEVNSDVSELQGIISGLLDWFYPIGTIYETTSSDLDTTTKMNTHFGGTWEAYGSGRVLVGKSADTAFDTVEKTGGAETVTLTSAQSGLPAHTHTQNAHSHTSLASRVRSGTSGTLDGAGGTTFSFDTDQGTAEATATNQNNTAANASSAHTNLQPYIVVHRYRRTA